MYYIDLFPYLSLYKKKVIRSDTAGELSAKRERQTLYHLSSQQLTSTTTTTIINGRQNIIQLIDSFEYNGHMCLVQERMHSNLRLLFNI